MLKLYRTRHEAWTDSEAARDRCRLRDDLRSAPGELTVIVISVIAAAAFLHIVGLI